ncbi:MAG: enoyl-CoA hydratase-related protein, partial [Oceanococcus sp.]
MCNQNFQLKLQNGIACLELCRPEQLNTFTDEFWGQLSEALSDLDQQPEVRALVVQAQGAHFSAGMDLDFFSQVRSRQGAESGRYREWLRRKICYLQKPMDQLEALRFPVIAASQGACIGAGLDLVCAADFRLSSADGFFAIHEINVAITADLGVLQRMPQLIAPAVVDDMALSGRKMLAAEALQRGFVRSISNSTQDLHGAAQQLALHLAGLSPLALHGTKAALKRNRRHAIRDGLDHMASWNAAMFISDDVPEAIQSQQQERNA